MEQWNGGELYEYVMNRIKKIKNGKTGKKEYKVCVNEATAAAIVRKVVDAVAYLHEHNMCIYTYEIYIFTIWWAPIIILAYRIILLVDFNPFLSINQHSRHSLIQTILFQALW